MPSELYKGDEIVAPKSPRSPGADYGLKSDDGFDPSRYDFYNPGRRFDQPASKHSPPIKAPDVASPKKAPSNHVGLSPIEELEVYPETAPMDSGRVSQADTSYFDQSLDQSIGHDGFPQEPNGKKDRGYEELSGFLFSRQHLELVLGNTDLSSTFRQFVRTQRPESLPLLNRLDRLYKALRGLEYAEAIMQNLEAEAPNDGSDDLGSVSMPWLVQGKLNAVLDSFAQEDFRAFVADYYAQEVRAALTAQVSGKRNSSHKVLGNVAEAFSLSDPARPDNPLMFTSDGFHQMTGYDRVEVLGKNCRLLSGRRTSRVGRNRFRQAIEAGQEHCELLLNYRRNGTQFFNLIACVPLRDQSGKIRYFLGAQFDATSLLHGSRSMLTVCDFLNKQAEVPSKGIESNPGILVSEINAFERLCTSFDSRDLRHFKNRQLHSLREPEASSERGEKEDIRDSLRSTTQVDDEGAVPFSLFPEPSALGFYQHYLVLRPYPSLKVIFASASLGDSQLIQAPLLSLVSASAQICQGLVQALEGGRKVTAKVRWLRSNQAIKDVCWIHCTPLIGPGDVVGVWTMILINAEESSRKTGHSEDPYAQDSSKPLSPAYNAAATTPWDVSDAASSEGSKSESTKLARMVPQNRDAKVAYHGHQSAPKKQPAASQRLRLGDFPASHDDSKIRGHSRSSASQANTRPALETAMKPKVRMPSSASEGSSKSIPIQTPGSHEGHQGSSSIPVRRTYKSLSPYGVLFQDESGKGGYSPKESS